MRDNPKTLNRSVVYIYNIIYVYPQCPAPPKFATPLRLVPISSTRRRVAVRYRLPTLRAVGGSGERWLSGENDLSPGSPQPIYEVRLRSLSWKLRMLAEITFLGCLTLYSWAPWGTVKFSTHPRPVPQSPRPVWEVWDSYLENCANGLRQTDTDNRNPPYW